MEAYILTSAIILILLGLTWSKKDLINVIVKVFLFLLGLCGIFYWMIEIGYIIKK